MNTNFLIAGHTAVLPECKKTNKMRPRIKLKSEWAQNEFRSRKLRDLKLGMRFNIFRTNSRFVFDKISIC